jgi:hypothetical protein
MFATRLQAEECESMGKEKVSSQETKACHLQLGRIVSVVDQRCVLYIKVVWPSECKRSVLI